MDGKNEVSAEGVNDILMTDCHLSPALLWPYTDRCFSDIKGEEEEIIEVPDKQTCPLPPAGWHPAGWPHSGRRPDSHGCILFPIPQPARAHTPYPSQPEPFYTNGT